ncbi:ATP-dependent zinc protease [Pseudomonas sp.]|uniref:retropepsin-like aspartic peptidase RloA3 n=1 Tax=Pseudomonas sp. TaxID=306 RepID=UPI0025D472A2|nr:ATP-dependent zinc protease [Pseudomonas sp.]
MEKNSPLIAMLLLAVAIPFKAHSDERTVHGWVEEAEIYPEAVPVKAKLDTGALTSSMDAKDVEYFEKGSKKWVRFKVVAKNSDTGQETSQTFERPLIRKVKLRGAGGTDHRPVVKMQVCIGQQLLDEEFSLRDRKNMIYPILFGRKTLDRIGPVDTRRTFTQQPKCQGAG